MTTRILTHHELRHPHRLFDTISLQAPPRMLPSLRAGFSTSSPPHNLFFCHCPSSSFFLHFFLLLTIARQAHPPPDYAQFSHWDAPRLGALVQYPKAAIHPNPCPIDLASKGYPYISRYIYIYAQKTPISIQSPVQSSPINQSIQERQPSRNIRSIHPRPRFIHPRFYLSALINSGPLEFTNQLRQFLPVN